MKKVKSYTEFVPMSEGMRWHLDRSVPLHETVYRSGSDAHLALAMEMRELRDSGAWVPGDVDRAILAETDLGQHGTYRGESVPLDCPFEEGDFDLDEAEYRGKAVKLNSPKRNPGGGKKYVVYTKNSRGNVIRVSFGDMKGGLSSKINDPEARANFAKRHDCENKKDKTTPGYWSCRLPRYVKLLGLKASGGKWW